MLLIEFAFEKRDIKEEKICKSLKAIRGIRIFDVTVVHRYED